MWHEFFVKGLTGTSVGILIIIAKYDNDLEDELTTLGNVSYLCMQMLALWIVVSF